MKTLDVDVLAQQFLVSEKYVETYLKNISNTAKRARSTSMEMMHPDDLMRICDLARRHVQCAVDEAVDATLGSTRRRVVDVRGTEATALPEIYPDHLVVQYDFSKFLRTLNIYSDHSDQPSSRDFLDTLRILNTEELFMPPDNGFQRAGLDYFLDPKVYHDIAYDPAAEFEESPHKVRNEFKIQDLEESVVSEQKRIYLMNNRRLYSSASPLQREDESVRFRFWQNIVNATTRTYPEIRAKYVEREEATRDATSSQRNLAHEIAVYANEVLDDFEEFFGEPKQYFQDAYAWPTE